MLQYVIRRARLETFNGGLFADRSGNQQERCFRAFLLRRTQGFQAVVRRQRIICQNDVELLRPQSGLKTSAAFDQDHFDLKSFPLQHGASQITVIPVIFEMQDAQ